MPGTETPDKTVTLRDYRASDIDACLAIFDANCPQFFAPNERGDYCEFLQRSPPGYMVATFDGLVVGAFGVAVEQKQRSARLNWIMIDPSSHGLGVGSIMMRRALETAVESAAADLAIAASQYSAGFFARFGAGEIRRTADGWGPGMDRVDMIIDLAQQSTGDTCVP